MELPFGHFVVFLFSLLWAVAFSTGAGAPALRNIRTYPFRPCCVRGGSRCLSAFILLAMATASTTTWRATFDQSLSAQQAGLDYSLLCRYSTGAPFCWALRPRCNGFASLDRDGQTPARHRRTTPLPMQVLQGPRSFRIPNVFYENRDEEPASLIATRRCCSRIALTRCLPRCLSSGPYLCFQHMSTMTRLFRACR